MAIRTDDSVEIILGDIDLIDNKADIRCFLLNQWIKEEESTKYRYFVETLEERNRVYLERPGRLNKGCDFVIYIENNYLYKNGNDRPPDHSYILNDLANKKAVLSQDNWNNFMMAIGDVYECINIDSTLKKINQLPESEGHSYELILKTIRWFFIEQDITYWSGKGRLMFYNAIQDL